MHYGYFLYASTLFTYGKYFLTDNNECDMQKKTIQHSISVLSRVRIAQEEHQIPEASERERESERQREREKRSGKI